MPMDGAFRWRGVTLLSRLKFRAQSRIGQLQRSLNPLTGQHGLFRHNPRYLQQPELVQSIHALEYRVCVTIQPQLKSANHANLRK